MPGYGGLSCSSVPVVRTDEKFLEVLQLTAAARVGGAPLRMTVYLIGNGHEVLQCEGDPRATRATRARVRTVAPR